MFENKYLLNNFSKLIDFINQEKRYLIFKLKREIQRMNLKQKAFAEEISNKKKLRLVKDIWQGFTFLYFLLIFCIIPRAKILIDKVYMHTDCQVRICIYL